MSNKIIKKNIKGTKSLKTNKKSVKRSNSLKTIKYKMNGSGPGKFRKQLSVKTTWNPRTKQLTKRYTKRILGIGLIPLPFLTYQGIKKIYKKMTPDKQINNQFEKVRKAVRRYTEEMQKPRGNKGESYNEKLKRAEKIIANNTSNKEQVKKALLTQAYIRAQISKHEYRARKFIKRYINRKNLDHNLYESIKHYENRQNNAKVILSSKNPQYIPDIEKIRYFLDHHDKNESA
jgi:hypothetical protein